MLKFVITTLFLYFLHLPILFSGSFVVLRFGNSSALLMQKTESVSEESKENHENNRLCQTSRISLLITTLSEALEIYWRDLISSTLNFIELLSSLED